ncbi:MAG: helix-turn-helix transcriptional regulator [Ilumatobacter sp.]|nr:helix-turn-helix transcriptional regulator [Ilumatobacter sp.]
MAAPTHGAGPRSKSNGADRLGTYASWLACLGDVSRLSILSTLSSSGGPMSVGELVRSSGLAQATVSYHLKVLADAGFVALTPSGTSTLVSINSECVMGLPAVIASILGDDGASEVACTSCSAPLVTSLHPDPLRN